MIKKLFKIILAIVIVVLLASAVMRWLDSQSSDDALPPPPPPGQPEWCPAVEVIAAPGTWESRADDDPVNPWANPASFMLTITQPLQAMNDPARVKVWTLPYPAQFKNIQDMNQLTYDDSRTAGMEGVKGEMLATHAECPLTDFILTGFSQGAVIMGDIANEIGNQAIPVGPERIRGVALIADGRREPGVGQYAGAPVSGVGAEVSLELLNPVVGLVMPGASMRGPRPGGFGVLNDRTWEICAPNDHICDAPLGVTNAIERAQALIMNNAIHAQYATNPDVFPGETTSQWVVNWAQDLINR